MKDILSKSVHLARLDNHVVIVGEMGTGKKRVSKIIHENSSRSDGPFHIFYCVDLNENDYKEAFWGSLQYEEEHLVLRYPALEEAYGGILYLDQFSVLPFNYMEKIVDSYLKGCYQLSRLNESGSPRLIVSINQKSFKDLQESTTWSYLLDKLDPVLIMLPPLREHREDIPVLIDSFLDEFRNDFKEWENVTISPEALEACCSYRWPGNIHQLKNAVMHGAILSHGETIEPRHLPFSMSCKLPYGFEEYEIAV